jgi:hypothetical protein
LIVAIDSTARATALRILPVMAVDLGFSGDARSCGVAATHDAQTVRPRAQRFGECVSTVINFAREHGEIVLVVEAPLSATFDARGNPAPRGDFERSPRARWWSLGAGAAMALAAQHFLSAIHESAGDRTVHLAEGFVVGADSGDHGQVATDLVMTFVGLNDGSWHVPPGRSKSVLDWVLRASGQASPVILAPRYA